MFIQSLIQTCAVRGITLSFDPEKGLHVQSPQGALTEALRAELKHHKPDIIHFLKSPQNLVANVASLGTESGSKPTVATLATDEQGPFVKSGGFLEEDHQNNPESLVANVATVGNRNPEEHSLPLVGINTPHEVTYRLISDIADAKESLDDLVVSQEPVGLDLETTGLFPHEGAKARLLQVSAKEGRVLVIDLFQVGGLRALKEPLQKLKAVAHNAVFEMKFLKSDGIPLTLDCTLLANHILTGKMSKLSDLCQQHLGIAMDKTLQTSDWGGDLTADQLTYAAADAYYTRLLFHELQILLAKDGGDRIYSVSKQAQQAVVEMELAGMPFDAEAHKALLEKLVLERDSYQERLSQEMGNLNLNSGKQLGEWLTEALGGNSSLPFKKWPRTDKGQLVTSEKDFRTSLKLLPEAAQELITKFFLPYKALEKQITSFGETLQKAISKDTGRIHANFKMTGTKTGRFSCSNPNLQQIPRDRVFRALFKAPQGRNFVIADYSQMELRVAAIVANEEKLLEAYREGKDTHAITAAMLLNKKPEEVTKQERQLAKAVNFGLLYGQGAKGLKDYASSSYGVEISEEEARQYS